MNELLIKEMQGLYPSIKFYIGSKFCHVSTWQLVNGDIWGRYTNAYASNVPCIVAASHDPLCDISPEVIKFARQMEVLFI